MTPAALLACLWFDSSSVLLPIPVSIFSSSLDPTKTQCNLIPLEIQTCARYV